MAEKNKEAEELKALQVENAELKAASAAQAEELKAKQEEIEGLKTEIAGLKEENETQAALIKEQAEALASKDEEVLRAGRFPVFTVGGKDYELVVGKSKARYEGKQVEITAKSLQADKKLLAHCIENGFGVLQEVKKGGK